MFISFSFEKIFNKDGKKRKVTIKKQLNLMSSSNQNQLIGLIPLNIKDRKAQIVVKTV